MARRMNPSSQPDLWRLHVILGGKVSRVRFRLFLREHAIRLGLRGWVRNVPGPRVEFVAEGTRPDLEDLLQVAKAGPAGAWVETCDSQWAEASGRFRTFRVRWLGFV